MNRIGTKSQKKKYRHLKMSFYKSTLENMIFKKTADIEGLRIFFKYLSYVQVVCHRKIISA